MSDPARSLTADEAMRRLGVSRRTLDRYVKRGLLHPWRRTPRGPRRFDATEVEQLAGPSTYRPDGHPLDPWQ